MACLHRLTLRIRRYYNRQLAFFLGIVALWTSAMLVFGGTDDILTATVESYCPFEGHIYDQGVFRVRCLTCVCRIGRVWCSEDIQCKLGSRHPEQTRLVMPTISIQHPVSSRPNKTQATTSVKIVQNVFETQVQLPQRTNHSLSFYKNNTAGNKSGQEVHVMISSSRETLGGMIALIHSIVKNTKAAVSFHLATENDSVSHIETWIKSSAVLRDIKREVVLFDSSMMDAVITVRKTRKALGSPLNFARLYASKLFPSVTDRLIYIDTDCIVNGDIKELAAADIEDGHAAGVVTNCNWVASKFHIGMTRFKDFFNYSAGTIRDLNIPNDTCSYNPAVMVVNVREWIRQNITETVEYWMQRNLQERLWGFGKGGGVSQPPIMLALYGKHSQLNPLWHIVHLGNRNVQRYPMQFLEKEARLLHWNGNYKPWMRPQNRYFGRPTRIWSRYYIPDPLKKFKRWPR